MQFRQRLGGEPIVGTFISLASAAVVEVMGRSGFDLVCIDAEHAPFTGAEIQGMILAADSVGVPTIVRVSCLGPEIPRALDSGASGVLVPMIDTAEQAAAVVDAVRYPPVGSRGAGIGRAAAYGLEFGGYLGSANDDVAAIVQIETRAAVENVDEIVAVPGVDMIFVGPGDLSVSLGAAIGSDEHDAAIEKVASAAHAAGMPLGMFCLTPDAVGKWAAHGASLFLLSGDLSVIASGSRALAEAGRRAVSA